MTAFVIGQRWASHADPQLGLGVVTGVEARRVQIDWPAAGESRVYAADSAPLSRIRYAIKDSVEDLDGRQYRVLDVEEIRGLLFYKVGDADGGEHVLPETQLNCHVHFTTPLQRLFSGQFDHQRRFQLRIETLLHRHRLQRSAVRGLLGARTDLLSHQIYIADEVARRHAPRVLLADEVGLGKTIEAGLILHRQVLKGQAERVLVLVPETLVHQWLVEMLRRFNLRFSVYDAARVAAPDPADLDEAEAHATGGDNPFEREQRIICSLELLSGDPDLQRQALAARWDMVVVDEAHHLHWTPQASSPEYDCVQALAEASAGLLLLTATPEQAGVAGHFARLRLLDPARFHDLAAFEAEEAGYAEVSALVEALQAEPPVLTSDQQAQLRQWLGDDAERAGGDGQQLIRALLDRHGTGRVLFRNSRKAVSGFPERESRPAPLAPGEDYLRALAAVDVDAPGTAGLYPERLLSDERWLVLDPRVAWLKELLASLRPEKVLIICHHASTALALEEHLRLRAGVRCSLFHEGMSIVERDRAAAYFAEHDGGAQVLICSEIGSEGRNFQFAHHLVLFDLPPDPDQVEQRIGRLDRIGQQQVVVLHQPYLEGTAQAVLFRWYDEGLGLFRHTCAAGFAIREHFAERLTAQLEAPDADLPRLIADTAALAADIEARQQAGRDRLLEINSHNPQRARALIAEIRNEEQSDVLETYMNQVFDEFGLEQEVHSQRALILRRGSRMHVDYFPGLSGDAVTLTYSRERALAREDMEFLSWEHPMVDGAMEMILNTEFGNVALATTAIQALPAGTLLVEAVFTVQVAAPRALDLEAWLPARPVRRLYEAGGRDLSGKVSHQRLNQLCSAMPRAVALQIVERVRDRVEQLVATARDSAAAELPELRRGAEAEMQARLGGELSRLEALRRVNPGVREAELAYLRDRIQASSQALERAAMQLQGLRLIVNDV